MAEFHTDAERRQAAHRKHRRAPSFFWPIILIGAGLALLLSNLGYLPWQSWRALWRLWPLLLIGLGIDVLIGRRSMLGSIVSGVLLLLLIGGVALIALNAPDLPLFARLTEPATLHTRHLAYPLDDLESASVEIDWPGFLGALTALEDSPYLIAGDIVYRGDLVFDVDKQDQHADVLLDSYVSGPCFGGFDLGDADRRWDVGLSPSVDLDLILDLGAGHVEVDLSELKVNGLVIDMGAGSANLILPSESSFGARIDGGGGSLSITLPESVECRVVLDEGSDNFRPGERFQLAGGDLQKDSIWETDDFNSAAHVVTLKIDQGAGSITIH